MLLMVGAVILVVVKGTLEIGGFDVVWERSLKGGRIESPSFQLDFTDRHTIWSLIIGGGVYYLQVALMDQCMIQRYMALPTYRKVKRAVWIFTFGTIFFILLSCWSGLVVYATYYDCDPLSTHEITAKDQILPLFVMQVLGNYPGMPGLFIAGLFGASLSTLSSVLHSMSAVVLEDFIKAFSPNRTLSNRVTNLIMKSVVIFFGALCVGLVFVMEKLGTVIQMSMSISAITSGPFFGIFCGGLLLPWMNAKGAFYGALLGLGASGFVILKAQNSVASGEIQFPTKSLSVDGCDYFYNATSTTFINITSSTESDVFPLFKMSYLWYTIFGGVITLILGIAISYFTGFNDPSNMNPLYLSPVIRKYLLRKPVAENKESELGLA